ncbi:hypothetical protein T265_04519 [Opisthorchis viverrini]|uniref:Uncharacterized protein n=1 Tax=Opisthorchis viverrini TaxID=6198 RepID=A0A074ZSD6_OPIVI|nr:hypothetical protein T265_04519 [Opisthorchis viverrini]KER28732.1 hypothetical protein T265_04519 [Opisthorchis viverrini]
MMNDNSKRISVVFLLIRERHSAVTPFRCLAVMSPEWSTRTGIHPGRPSLNRASGEAEAGFQSCTFGSPAYALVAARTCDIIIIIIIDSMTSVFNTDASLPYNHDLFESLIVKKRIKQVRRPG